jgi:hypothetical protein
MSRRLFLTGNFTVVTATMLGAARAAAAQPAPVSAGPADPALMEDLVAANRILVD